MELVLCSNYNNVNSYTEYYICHEYIVLLTLRNAYVTELFLKL